MIEDLRVSQKSLDVPLGMYFVGVGRTTISAESGKRCRR